MYIYIVLIYNKKGGKGRSREVNYPVSMCRMYIIYMNLILVLHYITVDSCQSS